MAKLYATKWQRYKYLLSGLLLILPCVFLYQSLTPEFPSGLGEQSIGEFVIEPMPFDENAPYQHDGVFVKDFLLTFKQGEISQIRQAFLNIGDIPMPIKAIRERSAEEGVLHGSRHGQHVHALAKKTLGEMDAIWLTIEKWDGTTLVTKWALPRYLLPN